VGQSFYGWTRQNLNFYLRELNLPEVHSKDLFRRAYKDLHDEPWSVPSLPRKLVDDCLAKMSTAGVSFGEARASKYDSSVKFRVDLEDGSQVEAVLMPEKQRITLCLSSQVGCAQGCVFCHTGRMGLKRQLTVAEIVGQVVTANRWLKDHPQWLEEVRLPRNGRITNIVFMGMGEPLDNVDAVIQALQILTDPYGLALGIGRISVSTAGHLDGIERLLDAVPNVRLALSVHSTDDGKRSKIMPINRRWSLATVIGRLKERLGENGSPVMLQYTMIKGVNDSLEEADHLSDLVVGLNAKINLIPLNEVSSSRLSAPDAETIQAFRDVLHRRGIRVMVRYSKGQDIGAACGQLIVIPAKVTEKSKEIRL
jgi:23S rRNA (adenine2503-C2)-methyltransferase